ncbi:RRQRL motif-containing zinc-binding protein [Nocardia neocaledoniensis]|uniref:RRQRL motif-containing zinc-binding protein n=1 Tax=Nocardia neocaledoniensis TaxID=236511 RepID=UPI00245464D8|nr:RRQRL motif-containing zinc-binding protein [Nocardia neocaledoniensis]
MSDPVPTYDWRTAPAHLQTKRQLAAQGLRPNGQDIAGRIVRSRGTRKEPLVAHLFDVNQAAPKRPATPAQLAALAKATRAHQERAAERHGVEIDQTPGDPGPAWTTAAPVNAFDSSASSSVNAFADVIEQDREEGMDR